MAKEIEKKYLLFKDRTDYSTNEFNEFFDHPQAMKVDIRQRGIRIDQRYLSVEDGRTLAKKLGLKYDFEINEARLRSEYAFGGVNELFFTLKGKGDLERDEEERKFGEDEKDIFLEYQKLTEKGVEKIRGIYSYGERSVEIDVYLDLNLIMAEVKFDNQEEANNFPPLGRDVTDNPEFKNKNLAK